jgi:hypothetical protein
MSRQHNNDFFPNNATLIRIDKIFRLYRVMTSIGTYLQVIDIVHFIEDDEFHIPDQICTPI